MAKLLRSKSQIYGLTADLQALQLAITAEETRATGVENALRTDLTAETQARIDADNAIAAAALKKALNLSDLTDVDAARANLSVDSSAQVDAKIHAAKIALGSNYTVADIAARDALEDLTVGDMVFVTDDGDGKWAQYQVAEVDADGKGTAWIGVMDQDIYLNSISASSIKAAYESNPDTNPFTDAEKAKLAQISGTGDLDFADVVKKTELIQNIEGSEGIGNQAVSPRAVARYVGEAVRTGGAQFKTESLIVANDKIVLAFAPKDGVIFNFMTVRHVDANSIAYDIPVIKDTGDADGKTYILSSDSAGEFDTKPVLVQYAYVPVA